ncbi:MAG: dihydrolipoyl dehydrogenase [Promethearchaeia archaeon]
MKRYDLLVVGSGAGANVAAPAYQQGLSVAIVDNGRFGGTCLNRGCIPTKILVYVADIIRRIEKSEDINLMARVDEVNFQDLMDRMHEETWGDSEQIERSVAQTKNYDFYNETGEFIDEYTMQVGSERIRAEYIALASGARPLIPSIDGIDDVDYHTSKTILEIMEKPDSLTIVGGGYVAAEFGHFFSAVGTDVTILGRNPYLVPDEDHDVSDLLKSELSKRMQVYTNHEVVRVEESRNVKKAIAKNRETEEERAFEAEEILIATGRRSNSDLLKPENTGVDTDERGWIIVDEYFRTSKERIWAFGDAIGKHMFRHVANDESQMVWHNMVKSINDPDVSDEELVPADYHAVPKAVFSDPQIATVGMTLREAKESDHELLVGKAPYTDTAKGMAMGNPEGFVRIIADQESGRLLGASIIGPHAPVLIQEIANLMYTQNESFVPLLRAIHIHPALSEVVQRAAGSLAPPAGHEHHHH